MGVALLRLSLSSCARRSASGLTEWNAPCRLLYLHRRPPGHSLISACTQHSQLHAYAHASSDMIVSVYDAFRKQHPLAITLQTLQCLK